MMPLVFQIPGCRKKVGISLTLQLTVLPVKSLMDSGASSSVVSEKFRRYLKSDFPAHNHTVLKVVNGNYVQPKGICTLQIGISRRNLPFEVIGLPNYRHDIILGWNFESLGTSYRLWTI
ncbi:transposon Ty3-I Gag-Pol polyprotein [Trichonephila clavipes]|nr:transposon Ty3-I Gag-Pol polyprotein [Trichonephila clavipes]